MDIDRTSPDAVRRRAYVQTAAERSQKSRTLRLRRLHVARERLDYAAMKLGRLLPEDQLATGVRRDARTTREMVFPSVGLRRDFLVGTSENQPLLARLVTRNEEALRAYLLFVLLEHSRRHERSAFNEQSILRTTGSTSWANLLGYGSVGSRAARERWVRTLSALADMDLVELSPPGTHGRYEQFAVLGEAGGPYRPPDHFDRGTLHLPVDLFLKGWFLVLTGAELATYLMLMDLRFRFNKSPWESVFITRRDRLSTYHLSDDVYVSHRELAEFGLVRRLDPMKRSGGRTAISDGSLLLPYEFQVHRDRLGGPAYKAVSDALTASPIAPRFTKGAMRDLHPDEWDLRHTPPERLDSGPVVYADAATSSRQDPDGADYLHSLVTLHPPEDE